MKHNRTLRRTAVSLVVAAFLPTFVLDAKAQGYGSPQRSPGVHPNVLFQRAWRLIRENFYDQSFNGQDWIVWKIRFDGKLVTTEDAHIAIETMLASLNDPWTRLLPSSMLDEDDHGFGVGLVLAPDAQGNLVVGAQPHTPASEAGVRHGWILKAVDGKRVSGLPLVDVLKLIRGEINTHVNLAFLDNKKEVTLKLQRADFKSPAIAFSGRIAPNVGYIRLDSLLASDLNKEMNVKLNELADTKALILDLRSNGLGLVTNAADLANMFLKRGVIFSTVDADGYKNTTFSMNRPIYTKPVVVLVDDSTSGMAEILAAALSESIGSTIIGERTKGKVTIQAINRLDDGSGINITIAKTLTPTQRDLTGVGIAPDHLVKVSPKDEDAGKGSWWLKKGNDGILPSDISDVQLLSALQFLKEKKVIGE